MSATKVANGNIGASRFVKQDTTAGVKDGVLQAAAGNQLFGISKPRVRNAPLAPLDDGFAAIAGENLMIYTFPDKDVLLELGGTVAVGDRLKSDVNGCGVVTTSTGDEIGARAEQAGAIGDLI